MNKYDIAEKKIENLESAISALRTQQLNILRKTVVKCEKCKKGSRIHSWMFIQREFYVAPYSCTGSDYWMQSKTETCDIVCPKCDAPNYIFNHQQRERIVKLVEAAQKISWTDGLFKEVRNEKRPR